MRGDGNGNLIISKVLIALLALSFTLFGGVLTAGIKYGVEKQKVDRNERDIQLLRQTLEENSKVLRDIQGRVIRIETMMSKGDEVLRSRGK